MPTPFLPINPAVTGSVSVQNRLDDTGVLATYVLLRGAKQAQFQLANTESPNLVFKIERNLIAGFSASLSNALASAVTGSF